MLSAFKESLTPHIIYCSRLSRLLLYMDTNVEYFGIFHEGFPNQTEVVLYVFCESFMSNTLYELLCLKSARLTETVMQDHDM